jgi:peptide/nickel transport system permease protein
MAAVLDKTEGRAMFEPARSRRSWLRTLARSRSAMIGLVIVTILALASLAAPLLTDADPNTMESRSILTGPSSEHPFGTDDFGRDVMSRVLYGGRLSIAVGVLVAGITSVTGLILGTLAGYYRRLDNPIMRVMDILMAFPSILLAIGVMAILGPRFINIVIALAIPYTPVTARVVRGEILQLRERDFAEAARAVGMSDARIMVRHLIPNSMAPILVQQTFVLALAILAESGLNFLGVGVPPSVPTLGSILADARTFLRDAYWMALFPGLFISLLVLGFNIMGDGLRDILDPHMRET